MQEANIIVGKVAWAGVGAVEGSLQASRGGCAPDEIQRFCISYVLIPRSEGAIKFLV
jgi:hypothetical protein